MDEDAYDMIAACTKAEELVALKKYHEKGGKVDMCQAIKEMLADERQFGREEALLLIVRKKINKNKTLDMISDDLEENIEVIRPIYEKAKMQILTEKNNVCVAKIKVDTEG